MVKQNDKCELFHSFDEVELLHVGHACQKNTRFRPPGLPLKFSRSAALVYRPDTYGRGLTSVIQLLMFFSTYTLKSDIHDCTREMTVSVAEFSCLKLFNTSLLTKTPSTQCMITNPNPRFIQTYG